MVSVLRDAGHDVVHTEEIGLADAPDPKIIEWCCIEERALVTADKKLTKFLASTAATCPTVVITRDVRALPASRIAAFLVANLPQIADAVAEFGPAVFVLAPAKPVRAELLPLGLPISGES